MKISDSRRHTERKYRRGKEKPVIKATSDRLSSTRSSGFQRLIFNLCVKNFHLMRHDFQLMRQPTPKDANFLTHLPIILILVTDLVTY